MKRLRESQIVRYVVTGGMTTAINYVIYLGLSLLAVNYLIANSIAWLGAVIFAYYANREVVFRSEGNKRQEFASFFALRLGTLGLENLLLFLLVDCAGAGSFFSKIAVSVITVVLNYFACKYRIFKGRGASHE